MPFSFTIFPVLCVHKFYTFFRKEKKVICVHLSSQSLWICWNFSCNINYMRIVKWKECMETVLPKQHAYVRLDCVCRCMCKRAYFGHQYVCCHIKCILFLLLLVFNHRLNCFRSVFFLSQYHRGCMEDCEFVWYGMSCATFRFHIFIYSQGESFACFVFFVSVFFLPFFRLLLFLSQCIYVSCAILLLPVICIKFLAFAIVNAKHEPSNTYTLFGISHVAFKF